MKKTGYLAIAVCLCLCLISCGDSEPQQPNDPPPRQQQQQQQKEPASANVEIVYQSLQKYISILDEPCAMYIAELKNTGTVPAEIFNISIDVEDASGSILKSVSYVSAYPDVIAPGESSYVCEEVVDGIFDEGVSLDNIGDAIFNGEFAEYSNFEAPTVEITEVSLGESYGDPNLVGRIENTGSADIEAVYIVADIRDKDGSLQNVIFTIVESLHAGDKKGFEQSALYGDPNTDYSASTINVRAYYPA